MRDPGVEIVSRRVLSSTAETGVVGRRTGSRGLSSFVVVPGSPPPPTVKKQFLLGTRGTETPTTPGSRNPEPRTYLCPDATLAETVGHLSVDTLCESRTRKKKEGGNFVFVRGNKVPNPSSRDRRISRPGRSGSVHDDGRRVGV